MLNENKYLEDYSAFYSFNTNDRFDYLTGEQSSNGLVFLNTLECIDLSEVQILHKGVDTLKPRYHGTHTNGLLNKLDNYCNDGIKVFHLGGYDFVLKRGGKSTRYKFMLQAKALGIIVHIGDFQLPLDKAIEADNGRAKYEFSPELIHEQGLENMPFLVSHLNQAIFQNFYPVGVDVHLCVDLQGWTPSNDLIDNITTMTRKKVSYNGIDQSDYDVTSQAVKYGTNDGFLFGRADSAQLAIYNKTLDSQIKGKSTWWESVYSDNFVYDNEKTVTRVELRLPSSRIKKLIQKTKVYDSESKKYVDQLGEPAQILDIESLIEHLNTLWRYGLSRLFRYDYSQKPNKQSLIQPIWQLLLEDIFFNDCLNPVSYKLDSITVDDSIDVNLKIAIGNLTTACAKAGLTDNEMLDTIIKLPVYSQLLEYVKDKKGLSESHYLQYLLDVYHQKKIEYDQKARLHENFTIYRRNYKRNNDALNGVSIY